ncbi:hypothetical protein HY643_03375 [Candidatus Woesearchaeota archaeon]|nr:hypothetical protein [Candidatus Woesearchaeota archaeon]
MRLKSRTLLLVFVTVFLFWFIKIYLKFPSAESGIIGVILTVTSILFGLLGGFFISELWTRYTQIRELQGEHSSEGLNMIKCAESFYTNKKFEKEFKKLLEKAGIVTETVTWKEGHLQIPYVRAIGDSFKLIKTKNGKENVYFENLLESYDQLVEANVKLDMLGKERLFLSEWFIILTLSAMILFSILFLDTSHLFYKVIILSFPAIIALSVSLLYDLDTLLWSKENISLEPNARLFDAIGVKRFYLKEKIPFLSQNIQGYRTEDDLEGELKEVYSNILKEREKGKI